MGNKIKLMEKIEKKLEKVTHELEDEEREFRNKTWEEYKRDNKELHMEKHFEDYIEKIKAEVMHYSKDIHEGKFRRSAEDISKLRARIDHVKKFAYYLKNERKRKFKEDKDMYNKAKDIEDNINILQDCANDLAKHIRL